MTTLRGYFLLKFELKSTKGSYLLKFNYFPPFIRTLNILFLFLFCHTSLHPRHKSSPFLRCSLFSLGQMEPSPWKSSVLLLFFALIYIFLPISVPHGRMQCCIDDGKYCYIVCFVSQHKQYENDRHFHTLCVLISN